MDNVKQMVWSFYKLIIHLITGECEVSRICSKDMHDNRMTTSFSKSLSLSKKLTIYRSIVFNGKPFNTQSAVDHVVKVKNIENTGRSMKQQLCLTNIKHCFEYLKHVNTFSESMLKKTKVVYNNQSLEHSSKLISLWTHLMGSDNRVPLDLENSEDWALIGFQGRNPATDFRGMGLLGLLQLEFFAANHTADARRVLQQANHERRYFPFAATGINVTQFILELLQTSRLHALLFIEIDLSFDSIDGVPVTMTTPAAVRSSSSSSVVPVMNISKDVNGVGARCEQKLHEIYSLLYCEFTELWVKRDPANVMEFPKIFGEFKDDVRGRGQFQPVNLMLRK